jgi:hypothetical protein
MRQFFLAIVAAACLAATAAFGLNLPFAPGQVTASATGVATLNQDAGVVTTQLLTTAGQLTASFTINCNQVNQTLPNSVVQVSVQNGSNTGGVPTLASVTTGNGVITVVVLNAGLAANAFNGTLKLSFVVFN